MLDLREVNSDAASLVSDLEVCEGEISTFRAVESKINRIVIKQACAKVSLKQK